VGAGLLPGLVQAQAIPRGEVQRGQTVADRPRADFDPLGVRLGAFRADVAAEAGLGYDSNIQGTRDNRLSDGFASLAAEAALRSQWSTHALGATARILQRSYFEETEQDWTDFAVGLSGRYDLTPDTSVEASYNFVQEHLSSTSVDVQQAGLQRPVPYIYNEVQAQAQSRFNRIGAVVLGNWRGYRFDNVDAGPATTPGGTPPGQVSIFDFDSAIAAAGLNYQLAPGRFVNFIVRYQNITYQDSSQSARDSDTWSALVGFTYDFDGVWGFNGEIGYLRREYSGPGLKELSAPTFAGTLTWQPTLLTTVSGVVRRDVRESIRGNAVSYVATTGALRVDHEYLRNVILGAEVGVEYDEYQQPDQQSTDLYAGLSARWLINRNLALVGSYQYAWRANASAGLDEYDRNLVLVRLRLAL
jgi:hypothetical protein